MDLRNVGYGVIGGIAGSLVFGAMMGMVGMLPQIGKMAGSSSARLGLVVHVLISAFKGGSFALLFGSRIETRASGLGA
jgi:hypothetical protein